MWAPRNSEKDRAAEDAARAARGFASKSEEKRVSAQRAALDAYDRPGGAALDRLALAKSNDPEWPYSVHVVTVDGTPTEVWLNTEVGDFDGLCLGTGPDCVAEAVRSLERAIEVLQQPPTATVYRPITTCRNCGGSGLQDNGEGCVSTTCEDCDGTGKADGRAEF